MDIHFGTNDNHDNKRFVRVDEHNYTIPASGQGRFCRSVVIGIRYSHPAYDLSSTSWPY